MEDERKIKEVIRTVKMEDEDKSLEVSRRSVKERKPRIQFDDIDLMTVLIFVTIWLVIILTFIASI